MSVTDLLLSVYNVDKQIVGLRSRLDAAETFLAEQTRQRDAIVKEITSLTDSTKQLKAKSRETELHIKSIDERIEKLREQMNNSQTNREYKALLTEVNTLKTDRDKIETESLEHLNKADESLARVETLKGQLSEREKLREVAASDRDARHKEIKTKLDELTEERKRLASEVPASELEAYERLFKQREEDAMAGVIEIDRKRHEFACVLCMMAIPLDSVNRLVARGALTNCSSCGTLLYVEDVIVEAVKK